MLVTGGSRGIGLAIAERFADAGAAVTVLSRSEPRCASPRIEWARADCTDREAVADCVERVARAHGRIDVCVANAGIGLVESFEDTDDEAWQRVLEVNLLSVAAVWRCALAHMTGSARGGRLIATSSTAALKAEARTAAYSASKAAVSALVQSLAIELAPRGITVNAVAPGEVDTRLNAEGRKALAAGRAGGEEAIVDELLTHRIPAGRFGRPEEIASLVAFLASSEAAFVTGRTIVADGGQMLT